MAPDLEESLMPLLFGRSAKLIVAFLLIRDSDCEMMTIPTILMKFFSGIIIYK